MQTLKEIYAYREMIFSLVHRDLKGRYKGSVLGFAWTFVNPLLQLAVYTLVFSVIMRNGIEEYYLYLFVALVPWIFFSTSVTGGATCIRNQSGMVTKIYFPREVIPISHVTSQFVNMLLSMIVVVVVAILSGRLPNPLAYLCLPLVEIIEYFIALGMTMIVSALTVYFRDLEFLMAVFMMAWQFLTPVMYGIDQVPGKVIPLFNLNPMTSIIVAYRDILYYGKVPNISTLLSAVLFGVIVMFLGIIVFSKLKRRFAEVM
jgi:lipopolysaccharide transport system permease protein